MLPQISGLTFEANCEFESCYVYPARFIPATAVCTVILQEDVPRELVWRCSGHFVTRNKFLVEFYLQHMPFIPFENLAEIFSS